MDQESTTVAAKGALPAGWRGLAIDLARLLRFYSRLPVPALPFEADPHQPPDLRRAAPMLPIAGLAIGLPGALALWLGALLGLPPLVAAGLSIVASALATGAFHEDGLADSFDGLASGWTRERRLEIMRDSRIGAYGATALVLALLLRVSAIAALVAAAGPPATLAVLGAAAMSRPIGLMPLALLPPARKDGASAGAGRPGVASFAVALALGAAFALALAAVAGLSPLRAALGVGLGLAAAGVMTAWARRAIGGQTGDLAGTCQQLAEIAFYVSLLILSSDGDSLALHQGLPPRP